MFKKSTLAVPLALALAFSMSACTGGDAGNASSGSATAGDTAACMATVSKAVDQARAPLAFTGPETSLDVSNLKGKKIWVINVLTNQFVSDANEGFEAAAAAAGVDLTIYDGQGTANGWNEGIQQAIAQGADAIALFGIDSGIVSEAVKDAAAAGIPVTESLAANYDAERHPDLFSSFSADYYADGATLANWTLADSNCTAETYFLYSSSMPIWVDMQKGALDTYAENCPECTISDENVNLANVAVDLPRLTQTKLTQSPGTDYILATWDSAAPFIESAASQVNPDVVVLGRDGIDATLEDIRTDGMQKVTVASPPAQWIAWVMVDDLLRGIAGEKPNGLQIPTRLIDKTNVGENEADVMSNYVDFESAIKKVWGL